MLIRDLLERSAERHPEREALLCDGTRLTYGAIDDAASRFGAGLRDAGIRRGDRVVIRVENTVEAVVALFGTLKAGAVIVPVGSTMKSDKLAYVLNDAEAAALVCDQRSEPIWGEALQQAAGVGVTVVVGGAAETSGPQRRIPYETFLTTAPLPSSVRTIDLDLAALIYTSGSTGRPKGVMLSHANMVAAARSIGQYLEIEAGDTILDVLPLSFDYGLYQVFLAFQAGARLVLERSFVYPSVMLDLMEREHVTGLPLVPTLAALLMNHDLSALDLSLRFITNTGAALPPPFIASLRRQLPTVRIFSMYGLTECKRVGFLPPEEIDQRPTSVGKPMPNVEVFVAQPDGSLSPTGVGELVVRGANVMQGYWRLPEATAQRLRPGFFPGESLLYTGDRFRIDDAGYMYFLDRMDDTIKSRGQRVSPQEVENVIYELPAVSGVAVVGTPDPVLGMALVAVITLREPGLTESEVLRHCARRLEDFMVPKHVQMVQTLPRTGSGKIDRRQVAADVQCQLVEK